MYIYGNLKSENSQDYAQKPQRNCTFTNSASVLHKCTDPVMEKRVVFLILYEINQGYLFSADSFFYGLELNSPLSSWVKKRDTLFASSITDHGTDHSIKCDHQFFLLSRDSVTRWIFFKVLKFETVLLVVTIFSCFFVKEIQNKVSACFYEITY